VAGHALAVGLRRVARAQGRARMGAERHAALGGQSLDFGQRLLEVLVDVVAERLERRYVNHFGAVRQRPSRARRTSESMATRNAASVLPEPVGAGDQDVASRADFRPPERLGLGGLGRSA